MAVYTPVSAAALAEFLEAYDLGRLRAAAGIAEGIENTNYRLETERGVFVLTLFERRVAAADLPFFLGLMAHLAARGVLCPTPVAARDGKTLQRICGKPAAVVTFLAGRWPRRPSPAQCRAVGAAMARLHEAARDLSPRRANDLGLAGWRRLHGAVGADADAIAPGLADELGAALSALEAGWPDRLPRGVIHADLFPDNVFFRGERVSGIIDFYFACEDALAYDLAVALNAWALDDAGRCDAAKARALIAGYESLRPLEPAERAALTLLSAGAALRFALTRLADRLERPHGPGADTKDPMAFVRRLRFHRAADGPAAYGLAA